MTNPYRKTVLITGGAQGIGLKLAELLARDGANLVLWDMDAAALERAKAQLAPLDVSVWTYALDITDPERVYQTAEAVRGEAGEVDVLVNNAGIVQGGLFLDLPDDVHVRTMQVNIIAYFYVTRAFLPHMIEKGQGHIVNLASAAGLVGEPGMSSYCASKFAVVGWTESLAAEMIKLGHTNIRFTTVCPSFVDTGMFAGVKAPWFTPLLSPEKIAAKIHKAIRKNRELVMAPFMVYLIPVVKAFSKPSLSRFINRLFKAESAMDTWRGR